MRNSLGPRLRRSATTALSIGAVLALATGLVSCSSGDGKTSDSSSPSDSSNESAPPEDLPVLSPLTGLEMKGKAPEHRLLVTKIDNTSGSAPQVGLSSADMVVEELVEGGMTRLAAFFWTTTPKVVGPVRSMRASDIGIVPQDSTIVTSGAANVTLGRIKDAGLPWVTEGDKGVYRDNSRYAPYNLFADLATIAKGARKDVSTPKPYLPFGDTADVPKGKKATSLTASFGGHTTSWQFQQGRYVNTNSYAADGDEFPATSILVLRVKVGDAGYRDPAGYPVPETKFEGKGAALLFTNGRVVKGEWSKSGLTGQISLSGKDGSLTVPAGHVWIELVPADSGDVTFNK